MVHIQFCNIVLVTNVKALEAGFFPLKLFSRADRGKESAKYFQLAKSGHRYFDNLLTVEK